MIHHVSHFQSSASCHHSFSRQCCVFFLVPRFLPVRVSPLRINSRPTACLSTELLPNKVLPANPNVNEALLLSCDTCEAGVNAGGANNDVRGEDGALSARSKSTRS